MATAIRKSAFNWTHNNNSNMNNIKLMDFWNLLEPHEFIHIIWICWFATSWRRRTERNCLQAFKKLLTDQKKVVFQEAWLGLAVLVATLWNIGKKQKMVYGDHERRRNAVSIWNSIGACQHYCRTAYNSRTAYWAQPTASQGYSIQSLLAAVLHHSWTASCTFGLHSHSTDCSWTASSSAAASVGGALCYFNVMWSCV